LRYYHQEWRALLDRQMVSSKIPAQLLFRNII